jgi:hypothetical protein
LENFFSTKLAILTPIQKIDWKIIENFQSYAKKSDFDPPFWIDPPFLANLTKYEFGS